MYWTRAMTAIAIAAICAGAALLRFSLLNAADANWSPVHLPIPTLSSTVSDSFHLASGGRFAFQVATTAREPERALNRKEALVDWLATFEISGPKGFRVTRTITRLESAAWSGNIEVYSAPGVLNLPRAGEYDIAVRSGSRVALFGDGGGVIQLRRLSTASYGLVYAIASGLAYFLFVFAAVIILVLASRRG